MTGSRLIVLATGISVSGVETWVWKLATRHSGRGDEAGFVFTSNRARGKTSPWLLTDLLTKNTTH